MINKKIIEISNLYKYFGKNEILKGVDLILNSGNIIALLGPNGAGKTTLINCLLGLIPYDKGEIKIFNEFSPGDIHARKEIGVIPQENSFYPTLSVRENVFLIAKLYRVDKNTFESRFNHLLDIFHFHNKSKELASDLSGGMKKRLMLMMALIHDPKFIIMDEPTAGVDPYLRIEFWKYFKVMKNEGKTILITTHHISEAKDCDEAIFMRKGSIIEKDSPSNILKKHEVSDLEEAYLKSTAGLEL